MPISVSDLEAAAAFADEHDRLRVDSAYVSHAGTKAFLSYSLEDGTLARGLQHLLRRAGWRVQVVQPRPPISGEHARTEAAALWIQSEIDQADWLIHLATANSRKSSWCAWEVGYADGTKSGKSIVIASTVDREHRIHGAEFASLYAQLSMPTDGQLAYTAAGGVAATVPFRLLPASPLDLPI